MAKLWHKDYSLDTLIEQFTVGDDNVLDRDLVNADCVASMAHADMLRSMAVLTGEQYDSLRKELRAIIEMSDRGEFPIEPADEDCHTAIENHLTAALGESGKRIHTGRSRNDQVIAALRLYTRAYLLELQAACLELASGLADFAQTHRNLPMPGRTHMQIAMPSSVGLWAGAFAEQIVDDLRLAAAAYQLNNRSPLGSAASYGVPLALDRERVADALAFSGVQNNVLYVNNSRGKLESIVLDAVSQIMLTLSKLAQDLILFSMPEFCYFTLPREICTGSSIMPQKRNPAMLELIRAKTFTVTGYCLQVKGIVAGLPSGYNQDFQETKAALIGGARIGLASVRVMNLVIGKLTVNEDRLIQGFIPEIYATDRALELVAEGMPFRDAYRKIGAHLDDVQGMDPHQAIEKKRYRGAPGNLGLDLVRGDIARMRSEMEREGARIDKKIENLVGRPVAFYR